METLSSETQRRASLPDVPADTGEEFDAAAETEEAHGKSASCITQLDGINDTG
jgi:hypothetical protein